MAPGITYSDGWLLILINAILLNEVFQVELVIGEIPQLIQGAGSYTK